MFCSAGGIAGHQSRENCGLDGQRRIAGSSENCVKTFSAVPWRPSCAPRKVQSQSLACGWLLCRPCRLCRNAACRAFRGASRSSRSCRRLCRILPLRTSCFSIRRITTINRSGFGFLRRGLHDDDVRFVSTRKFIHLLLGHVLGDAVAFLYFSDQLIPLAVNRREIIVGEFAPLLFHFADGLLPLAFDLIPVHFVPPELNIQLHNHSGDKLCSPEYSATPNRTGQFALRSKIGRAMPHRNVWELLLMPRLGEPRT